MSSHKSHSFMRSNVKINEPSQTSHVMTVAVDTTLEESDCMDDLVMYTLLLSVKSNTAAKF